MDFEKRYLESNNNEHEEKVEETKVTSETQ